MCKECYDKAYPLNKERNREYNMKRNHPDDWRERLRLKNIIKDREAIKKGTFEQRGYRSLMAAIIAQAKEDKDEEWLLGDMCKDYCEVIGFDHNAIVRTCDTK